MIIRRQPIAYYRTPREIRLNSILSVCEILVCLALLALFVALFVKALAEDDPLYRTDTGEHYQRIATLCPNLSGQEQTDCYAWLRSKGGRYE